VALALAVASPAVAATRRFAVIVGNNRGADPGRALRWAEEDARQVYAALRDLGDFAPDDVRLVVGQDAAAARAALRETEASVRAISDQASTLFLFYFSGHADDTLLELGSTSLPFDEIRAVLEGSEASVRLALVDTCQSGKLVAAKGGRRREGFQIDVVDELTTSGFAIITSSSADELSQESAEIRGAFFTHYLLSALRGAADVSGDGRVTLEEAYGHAYSRTVARTGRSIGAGQHPMYEFELAGHGELVLTRVGPKGSGVVVRSSEVGRLLVVDGTRERMIAEVETDPDRSALLRLPPGHYQLYHLAGDELSTARLEIGAGERPRLDTADFERVALQIAVAKGGLFRESYRPQVSASFVWRRWALSDWQGSYGAAVQVRADGRPPLAPTLRLVWTTAPDVRASSGYHDLGVLAGAGTRLSVLDWLGLRVELLAGIETLRQSPVGDRARHAFGAVCDGQLGLEAKLGLLNLLLGGSVGWRAFRLASGQRSVRLDLMAHVGVALALE
jgi:hypothetical protein